MVWVFLFMLVHQIELHGKRSKNIFPSPYQTHFRNEKLSDEIALLKEKLTGNGSEKAVSSDSLAKDQEIKRLRRDYDELKVGGSFGKGFLRRFWEEVLGRDFF